MKTYICIDLKSFYASVECVDRGLDPLNTNLVVGDESRSEKTICLAVTPALKSFGIGGRARLFEVIQRVNEINNERKKKIGYKDFIGESCYLDELNKNPYLKLSFLIATPRMAKYIDISTKIYSVYLKYVAASDIHVYSIDEVFMDVTNYLPSAKITAHEFVKRIIKDVMKETNVTATAGIGSNMYLAKVAMDIVAKHVDGDKDGVRIASLDEMSQRHKLWSHRPLTDFWRVGRGICKRLENLGLYTMGDIARCSLNNEDILFKEFGVNAEFLIDHAWGYEPTTMEDIKSYRPKANCLTSGQVLSCGYDYNKARVVVLEMAEYLSLELVKKNLVTNSIGLSIGYDIDNLKDEDIMSKYDGKLDTDYIGRTVPKGSKGSVRLANYTSSTSILIKEVGKLYDKIASRILFIRRLNVSVNVINDDCIKNRGYQQFSLFDELDDPIDEKKEKKLQKAIVDIKSKYGKNSVLKAMDLADGATTIERNNQIGGHKA